MNAKNYSILSLMVEQFRQRHQRLPQTIVATPLASLALAIKSSLSPRWNGIPVECREVREEEATKETSLARSLAVFLKPNGQTGWLVCCDLKS